MACRRIKEKNSFFDVLVLPSTNPDPLPTVVLEAMGCGTTVVGYNHGGVTEMVINGETGLLAEVKNSKDLGKKIQQVLESDYKLMGQKARDRAVKNFSEYSFINNFSKVYDI